MLLPVFEEGHQEYTVEQLVSFLLGDADDKKVCKVPPTCVKHNCSFLVDLKCIIDVSDLRADDCGVWSHRGVRKSYIVINDLKDILLTTREQPPVSKNIKKNHLYLLTRVYHDLQASQDFKRMIATLKSQCFVFYVFKYVYYP